MEEIQFSVLGFLRGGLKKALKKIVENKVFQCIFVSRLKTIGFRSVSRETFRLV